MDSLVSLLQISRSLMTKTRTSSFFPQNFTENMVFITKNYPVINLALLFLFLLAIIPLYTRTPGLISRPFNAAIRENQCNLSTFSQSNVTLLSPEQEEKEEEALVLSKASTRNKMMNVTIDELEEVLSKASTEKDKTVIIAIVNRAYVEPNRNRYPTLFDIFLEGFWVGEGTQPLVDHLLVVALDQAAYNRCKFKRLNCYRLVIEGVDFAEEKLFMSEDFVKLVWARIGFLLQVLKRGYNFIFTDTDTLFLRDPFPVLNMFNETDDMQISTDWFNGRARGTDNQINTGFYHVRSNNKTIALFETWYHGRHNSTDVKEQDVLQDLITEGGIIEKLGLTVRFLDTVYFSGFCANSKDVRKVTTVHANCCRSVVAKVADLTRVLTDWKTSKKFRRNLAANYSEFKWSSHSDCKKSWKKPPPNLI